MEKEDDTVAGSSAPGAAESAVIDADFLAILRCPISRRPLVQKGNLLCCYDSRKAYRIEDGIPVMRAEEAIDIPAEDVPEELRDRPVITSPDEEDSR
ncbi:MAG: Trm112 family protein [Planctomycetota bacterium]